MATSKQPAQNPRGLSFHWARLSILPASTKKYVSPTAVFAKASVGKRSACSCSWSHRITWGCHCHNAHPAIPSKELLSRCNIFHDRDVSKSRRDVYDTYAACVFDRRVLDNANARNQELQVVGDFDYCGRDCSTHNEHLDISKCGRICFLSCDLCFGEWNSFLALHPLNYRNNALSTEAMDATFLEQTILCQYDTRADACRIRS